MANFSMVNFVKFYNGIQCPTLGFGTYLVKGRDCYAAVREAIRIGYRHIDTASYYENEAEVGEAVNDAIKELGLKREEFFIVTKLPGSSNQPSLVVPALKNSLNLMKLDYVDLYLVHTPVSRVPAVPDQLTLKAKFDESGKGVFFDMKVSDVWKEMERCCELQLAKSIGVSNFNSEQIQEIVDNGKIKPVTNQVEVHPFLQQDKLRKFCGDRGIILTAYRPLGGQVPKEGKPPILQQDIVKNIAQKHGKSPGQVLLRWHLENKSQIVLVKASSPDHIKSNCEIFDFSLDKDDMEQLSSLEANMRYCPFLESCASKQYPFHIDF